MLRVVFVSRRSCEQAIAFKYWFEWEKQPARCEPGPHSRAGKPAGLQVTAKGDLWQPGQHGVVLGVDTMESMILPQVHLRKPCYDFSFL